MNGKDALLLEAIGRGDRAALEQVYRAHKDDLATAAYHLLGDSAAAEDVLQDVFVMLARKAGEIRLQRELKGYLFAACLNRARDLLRRRRLEPDPVDRFDEWRSESAGPDAAAAMQDETAAVAAALGTLPDEQREVVVLRFYGQMKFREIAELLSVSVNTAQSRHRYALKGLREQLAPGKAER